MLVLVVPLQYQREKTFQIEDQVGDIPILEFLELLGLLQVTLGKKTFNCE